MSFLRGALCPPPGGRRIGLAVLFGLTLHTIFVAAVLAMILTMFFGMSRSLGNIPWPFAVLANLALILQFPLLHSLLLTQRGTKVLSSLGHSSVNMDPVPLITS